MTSQPEREAFNPGLGVVENNKEKNKDMLRGLPQEQGVGSSLRYGRGGGVFRGLGTQHRFYSGVRSCTTLRIKA